MTIGRDQHARIRYQKTVRKAKKEMILHSQCDEGRSVGLLRGYMANDFDNLARIRNRKAITRGDKMKRKADFFIVLARMAERLDRLQCGF